MQGTPDLKPLEPTQAIVWDGAIAACIMFVVWVLSDERDASLAYLRGLANNPNSGWLGLGIISFCSTLAFIFNIANYYFIHYTSALTMTVGGNGIKVFLICLTAATGGGITIQKVVGVIIVVCAICSYGYFSFNAKKKPPPAKVDDTKPEPKADETTPLARP